MLDVVYTWVDASNEDWLRLRNSYLYGAYSTTRDDFRSAGGDARHRDNDELRYSLRSLERYGKEWIRNIYIVSPGGRRPRWLSASSSRVHIIDDRTLLPAYAAPTFNSRVIELYIHRIPGLTSNFVYFNDDMLLGAPASEDDFVDANGRVVQYLSQLLLPLSGSERFEYADGRPAVMVPERLSRDMAHWLESLRTTNALLDKRYGVERRHLVAHAPRVVSIETMERIHATWPEEIRRVSKTRFRSVYDFNITFLYHNFLISESRCTSGSLLLPPVVKYIHELLLVDKPSAVDSAQLALISIDEDISEMIACINDTPAKFICIVDTPRADSTSREVLRQFLERRFSKPSSFELE